MTRSAVLRRFALFVALLTSSIAIASTPQEDSKPVRALLVIGGCCHDYAKQKDLLTKGVSSRANVQWAIAYDADKGTKHLNPIYENQDWAKGYDVIVHDECCADVKDKAVVDRILQPHRDGVPGVVLHCGIHCYRTEGYPKATTPWFEFTGLASTGHGPQAPIAITFLDNTNVITKGLTNWKTNNEELYNNYTGNLLDTATPLAKGLQTYKDKSGKEVSAESVVVWTNTYNKKTKVFATTLGHNNETVSDEKYLDLVAKGLLWTVGKLDDAHLKPAKQVMLDN